MGEEGQEVEQIKHHRERLLPVPLVVLEFVALIVLHVELRRRWKLNRADSKLNEVSCRAQPILVRTDAAEVDRAGVVNRSYRNKVAVDTEVGC